MNKHSERLGEEKVGKLLKDLSIPAMIAMLVMAFYNVVDAIFIGRGVGTLALAGISITFPIIMIMMAVSAAIGIGGSSIVSRRLGANLKEEANIVFGNVISLIVVISVISTILGLIFIEPILKIFAASNDVLPYARDYLSITFIGLVFFLFGMSINNIIRSEGNAKTAMFIMIFSSVINIILDPIFIFVFKMGVKGAAIATVLSQLIAVIYVLYYFLRGKSSLKIYLNNLKLKKSIVTEIIAVGSPAFFRHVAGSVMILIINHMLSKYGGDNSIAVYGVINRLMAIVMMPVVGVIQGTQPIIGYNYGAKKMKRVKDTLYLGFKVATIISTIAFIIMMIFPKYLMRIFSSDIELISGGTTALRIIFAVSFLIGVQMIIGGFYQALGKARQALVLTMARQIIVFIPLVLVLPLIWGLNGVWITFPLSDFIAFFITIAVFLRDKKRGILEVPVR